MFSPVAAPDVADFDEAIRLDPQYAEAYSRRGLVYDGKGEYDHAIADCTTNHAVSPASSPCVAKCTTRARARSPLLDSAFTLLTVAFSPR